MLVGLRQKVLLVRIIVILLTAFRAWMLYCLSHGIPNVPPVGYDVIEFAIQVTTFIDPIRAPRIQTILLCSVAC
jgi:hypothetical protein